MKEILVTVTQRSQVTVPAEVLRLLGVAPRDKLAFQIEGDQVRLIPAKFTLESAYGSISPRKRPEDFELLIEEAMDEHADEVVRELGNE